MTCWNHSLTSGLRSAGGLKSPVSRPLVRKTRLSTAQSVTFPAASVPASLY